MSLLTRLFNRQPVSPQPVVDDCLTILAAGGDDTVTAARALGRSRDPRAVEPLIAALEKIEARIARHEVASYQVQDRQIAIATALGQLRDSRAVGGLLKLALCHWRDVARSARQALEGLGKWWRTDAARTLLPDILREIRNPHEDGSEEWPRKALRLIDPALAAEFNSGLDKERAVAKATRAKAEAQSGFCQACGRPAAPYQWRQGRFACGDPCLNRYLVGAAFHGMAVAGSDSSVLAASDAFCWACGKPVAPRTEICGTCAQPQKVFWADVDVWSKAASH